MPTNPENVLIPAEAQLEVESKPELNAEQIMDLGDLENPRTPFTRTVVEYMHGLDPEIVLSQETDKPLSDALFAIEMQEPYGGYGHVAPTWEPNPAAEALTVAKLAVVIKASHKSLFRPLVVSIDDLYRYKVGQPRLIEKFWLFPNFEEKTTVLIVADIAGSFLFTKDVLERIPTQRNAQNNPDKKTSFGRTFQEEILRDILPKLLRAHRGDVHAIIGEMVRKNDCLESEAKVFLATCLLAQQQQDWQDLSYGGMFPERNKISSSMIVGPGMFHHALQRVNASSGQADYVYRAKWGNALQPEHEYPIPNFETGGISTEEFERIVMVCTT